MEVMIEPAKRHDRHGFQNSLLYLLDLFHESENKNSVSKIRFVILKIDLALNKHSINIHLINYFS